MAEAPIVDPDLLANNTSKLQDAHANSHLKESDEAEEVFESHQNRNQIYDGWSGNSF